MKCKSCSKIIPNGFIDCPWCGAVQTRGADPPPPASLAPGVIHSSSASALSNEADQKTNLLLLVSIVIFFALNYVSMIRNSGTLTLANSSFFLGRCTGSFLLGAILVLIYYKIRRKTVSSARKLQVIFVISSVFTVPGMTAPHPRSAEPSPADLRMIGDELKNGSDKWAPATRSMFKDLVAYRQQYVAAVSDLDKTAEPLYTIDSFRDAGTVQRVIEQLQARQAVAEKYGDVKPVLKKMKGYIDGVSASERDKKEFMIGFESTEPQTLATYKAVKDKELAWLRASLELYQFVLSGSGKYSVTKDKIVFQKLSDSETFNQKYTKARMRNAEFIQAFTAVRQRQEALIAQMGLQGTEYDSYRPQQ
jgi:hypothetical protein